MLYRNLTDDVDEATLGQTFGEFGTMEKVKMVSINNFSDNVTRRLKR